MNDTHPVAASTGESKPDLGRQMTELRRTVTDKATEVKDTVSRVAGEQASELATEARTKIEELTQRQKEAGADYVGSIAQAVDRAAGEFEETLPQATRYIRAASGQIQGVADAIRDRNGRELLEEVRSFARRQPELFFGGALLLGFAAWRFYRSADGHREHAGPDRDYDVQPDAGIH
jgi:hypothetical protein